MDRLAQQRAHAVPHLSGRGHGVGEGEHLLRLRVPLLDQAGNAVDQDRSFPCAGSRDHQHRSVNVLNRFALAIIGNKRGGMRL